MSPFQPPPSISVVIATCVPSLYFFSQGYIMYSSIFFFNWSIVNLKYCASIHCTGDYRGWDGWMVSLTQWTWVWVDWGSWWWTGRPGVLWFMGSQRVRHDWVTELNWTEDQLHLMWLLIKLGWFYYHDVFNLTRLCFVKCESPQRGGKKKNNFHNYTIQWKLLL